MTGLRKGREHTSTELDYTPNLSSGGRAWLCAEFDKLHRTYPDNSHRNHETRRMENQFIGDDMKRRERYKQDTQQNGYSR